MIEFASEKAQCESLPALQVFRPTCLLPTDAVPSPGDQIDLIPEAWCEDWGTATSPTETAPYGRLTQELTPPQPKNQTDRQLRTDEKELTMAALFTPVGGNRFRGFQTFRDVFDFGLWAVAVPPVIAVDELDPTQPENIPIRPPRKGYYYVVGALMLDCIRCYVVCHCCSNPLRFAIDQ